MTPDVWLDQCRWPDLPPSYDKALRKAVLDERWPLAKFIADRTIEARGFFEWEAEPKFVKE